MYFEKCTYRAVLMFSFFLQDLILLPQSPCCDERRDLAVASLISKAVTMFLLSFYICNGIVALY